MTTLDVVLVALVVLLACVVAVGGGVVAWLFTGRAIQAMRFDLDAAAQALKMQETIDRRVAERTTAVVVGSDGRVRAAALRPGGLPEQPPAPQPSVVTRAIIDDIHEIERESNRLMGDAEYGKRDLYAQAPLPMET